MLCNISMDIKKEIWNIRNSNKTLNKKSTKYRKNNRENKKTKEKNKIKIKKIY